MTVFVVFGSAHAIAGQKMLGVFATAERAVAAHDDGLWMEAKSPDLDGRRRWINQHAYTWGADPDDAAVIVEVEVVG